MALDPVGVISSDCKGGSVTVRIAFPATVTPFSV